MRTQHWTGKIFADYHQFYLWDKGMAPEAPTEYSEQDVRYRIKTGMHVVVIQPERNLTVPVAIEVHDSEPGCSLDRWDHVAEASLHLPTGALQVESCTGGSITEFEVVPGWYRVRSFHANLTSISIDGLEGEDTYKVVVWPAPCSPTKVLKQFTGAK